MAEISSKDVMALRGRTNLPMMDCKAALAEAGGDINKAEELLRKKLKGKMDARTDRAAGEGRVTVLIAPDQSGAAIVEVRSETDFTAKNDGFGNAVAKAAAEALKLPEGKVEANAGITAAVDEIRISTSENCSFARGFKYAGGAGKSFGSYVHHDGKTAVLLQAEGSIDAESLAKICMHITAAVPRPVGVTADDIPAEIVDRERKFRIDQAMESGKPKEIAEKMVEGGMRKFFEEVALIEQPYVIDPTKKVKDILGNAKILRFLRWQVGEQA
jgi:elongation factor Ts